MGVAIAAIGILIGITRRTNNGSVHPLLLLLLLFLFIGAMLVAVFIILQLPFFLKDIATGVIFLTMVMLVVFAFGYMGHRILISLLFSLVFIATGGIFLLKIFQKPSFPYGFATGVFALSFMVFLLLILYVMGRRIWSWRQGFWFSKSDGRAIDRIVEHLQKGRIPKNLKKDFYDNGICLSSEASLSNSKQSHKKPLRRILNWSRITNYSVPHESEEWVITDERWEITIKKKKEKREGTTLDIFAKEIKEKRADKGR